MPKVFVDLRVPALLKQYPGAEYMLKDRVLVDFLQLKPKHTEPRLHSSILENMKRFILELGKSDFLYRQWNFGENLCSPQIWYVKILFITDFSSLQILFCIFAK